VGERPRPRPLGEKGGEGEEREPGRVVRRRHVASGGSRGMEFSGIHVRPASEDPTTFTIPAEHSRDGRSSVAATELHPGGAAARRAAGAAGAAGAAT
jgi:acyl-coenzyme A thioesterase PaaI-like protein